MIIGIITKRENDFIEISGKIREILKRQACQRLEQRTVEEINFTFLNEVENLKQSFVLYGLDMLIFDLAFVELLPKDILQKIFRTCRQQNVPYIIGAPEYPDQAAHEMSRLIRTELNRVKESDILQRVHDYTPPITLSDNSGKEHQLLSFAEEMPIRVGIVGNGSGAGASFITSSIARELTGRAGYKRRLVTVIGIEDTYYFDSLGMEKRFRERDFFDFLTAMKEKKNIRGEENVDERINWVIRTPFSEGVLLSLEEAARLLYRSSGTVILWDFSGGSEVNYKMAMLREMDFVIFVVDPLPSKLLDSHRLTAFIRELDCPVILVLNKWNKGVNKKEALRFLRMKTPVFIPWVESQIFYEAEYRCKIPYSMPELEKSLQSNIGQLADLLLSPPLTITGKHL